MRNLNLELRKLCRHNADGSFKTQAERTAMLQLCATQLHDLGYRHMKARSLRHKHIDALVAYWQQLKLSSGTLKNRLAALRWWAEKINKPHMIAQDNGFYGIAERHFVARASKAQTLIAEQLAKIPEPSIRLSLELQQAFGLRREEAVKFIPDYADQSDHLRLKPTWTKGGKTREIPILTDAQRELLQRAHRFAGRGSLIPPHRSYIQQLRIYERHTTRAGLSKLHGLRHYYAQQRYEALTGWPAPAAGGSRAEELSPEQKGIDREARLTISRELGHERWQITAVFLGR